MTELRLGFHGSDRLPKAIVRTAGLAPNEVELVQYDVRDPFTPLRTGRLDVMITKFDHREPGLCYGAPLAVDPRAVLVGAGHPLAGRAAVSVEDVAEYACFDRPGDLPAEVWDEVVPPVTPRGRPIRRDFELTTVAELMRVVAAGAAVHLTVASIADVAPPAVRVLPVPDLPPARVQLTHLPDPPDRVRAFLAASSPVVPA
ncbi:MAG TPA: substrate-binding domain-containing protein [Actinophytocola sp.]|uniref:substrate-binding domain-containing protein n=1 Tax=Actinophytocola sp. TaxID=1872138 RepID=UPI002DBD76C4|nr:substrate-binding domain-containing protein [Actinophytocola sp.]HEU5475259.1 substrate-binding domain-containing protein [Actinophytocola sp.]